MYNHCYLHRLENNKKRKYLSLPNMPAFESTIITDKEGMSLKHFKRNKPPHNEIRKEIFKLESKLTPPLNRNRGETVEAWLGRINSEEDVNIKSPIIIDAYNTVRYSNEKNTVLLHEFKEEVHKLYVYQKSLKKEKNNATKDSYFHRSLFILLRYFLN